MLHHFQGHELQMEHLKQASAVSEKRFKEAEAASVSIESLSARNDYLRRGTGEVYFRFSEHSLYFFSVSLLIKVLCEKRVVVDVSACLNELEGNRKNLRSRLPLVK